MNDVNWYFKIITVTKIDEQLKEIPHSIENR